MLREQVRLSLPICEMCDRKAVGNAPISTSGNPRQLYARQHHSDRSLDRYTSSAYMEVPERRAWRTYRAYPERLLAVSVHCGSEEHPKRDELRV